MIGFGSPGGKEPSETYELLSSFLPATGEKLTPRVSRLNWKVSDPFEIYSRLRSSFDSSFILESSAGPDELAKYTFLGFDPRATLSLSKGTFKENGETVLETDNPLPHLKELEGNLNSFTPGGFAGYLGGLVGYIGYDFVRYLEDLPTGSGAGEFPDLQMGLFTDGIIHRRKREELIYFTYGEDRSSRLNELLYSRPSGEQTNQFQIKDLKSDFARENFTANVRKAKDYIHTGDIYQTVLSRRLTGIFTGDQFRAYRKLRSINPSPYMYHLKFQDRCIIGSSPEELVSVTGDSVSTYPIAGTRPLGKTRQKREELRTDLLTDEKERAEHNMLVDLARNDVGKVAKYGTVEVPEYMEIKKFSHVQHIVSRVIGKLSSDRSKLDALIALFPAGTVSGAPKVRAMELIDELEVSPREAYSGAVGYLSFTGDLDSCITIRTLFTNNRRIALRAGAGIVADSNPEKEWKEINHKLRALRDAVSTGGAKDDRS